MSERRPIAADLKLVAAGVTEITVAVTATEVEALDATADLLQVADWRARTDAASAGHLVAMQEVVAFTKESLHRQATSHGLAHLTEVSEPARHV
jgi:hypothetical protein